MTFNLSYDAAATVFLLIICWQFFSQRQFPLLSNRVFAGLLILTVSNLALDILGTIVLNPIGRFPLWLCYAVNILYYMVELLLPSALTIYVLALAIMDSVLSSRQVTENHVPFWVVNASDIAAIRRENDIESALRDAIPQAEGFELFCQPIYRHDKGCFDSGELLLRFRAPELGPISPDEFISVAENNALATSLDRMVVSMAFDAISEGRFDGLGFHHIQLNLSAASIIDPETVSAIIDIAESRGIDPAFVVFEITETTTTFSEELAVESIHRLQEYGFRFALDDFGTGYATITRLVELPFCIVKLDRTLLSFSPDLFRRIIRLFEHMDVELVAEGVETDEQSDFVVSTGIRLIQGYRYSKPMPIGELKEFLRRDKKPVRLVI